MTAGKTQKQAVKYHSVMAVERGGPHTMQIVAHDLRPPRPGEARIRVLAASVSLPDVQARYGQSPFKVRLPFTPGYAVVGEVDAVGEGVNAAAPGQRVAVLTVYGGYAEYLYWDASRLIPVPPGLDPAGAVVLVLNYIVAYQTLHRSAKVQPGDKVLIIGASGGIGTAYLQLGKLAGLQMYGLASTSKHHILESYGAKPIDYHTQDFVEVIRRFEPAGLDAVFDGVGGAYIRGSYPLLRRGGKLVCYGNPIGFGDMLSSLGQVLWYNLLPDGKSAAYYGTGAIRLNRAPFLADWAELFRLLGAGEIAPLIHARFPICEAAAANALLESGKVVGNVVLQAQAV